MVLEKEGVFNRQLELFLSQFFFLSVRTGERMEIDYENGRRRRKTYKSDLPINLPSLATSYVRQNNDLRKTLRRFEREKQKKLKTIDSDILDLHKFLGDLKCVISFPIEKNFSLGTTSEERHVEAVTEEKQNELLFEYSNKTPSTSSLRTSDTVQKIESDQTHTLFTIAPKPRPCTGYGIQTALVRSFRRRSLSVGEMCSGTLNHLSSSVRYNQPLLQRRKSYAGNDSRNIPVEYHYKWKMGVGKTAFNGNTRNLTQQAPCTGERLEESKLNGQTEKKRKCSILFSRPPSMVVEEPRANETIQQKGHSRSNSPSSIRNNIPEVRNYDNGILISLGNYFKISPIESSKQTETKNLSHSSTSKTRFAFCRKGFSKNVLNKDTFYTETRSSLLRKQSTQDLGIGLSVKQRDKA